MSNIALTLDDCIAISNARNEPLEATIRRIHKLDRYESTATIGKGPKVAKLTTAERKVAARKRSDAAAKKAVKSPTIAPKAKPEAKATIAPTKGAKGKTAANWAGKQMLSGKGTASSGQVKWLVNTGGMTPKAAKALSMVQASNIRAEATGKIA